jgi:seryl-tRNA synthetase
MHDIRVIRADPAAFDAAMARRGLALVAGDIVARDAARRGDLTRAQELQAARNVLSRRVGDGRRRGEDTTELEAQAGAIRADMEILEKQAATAEDGIRAALATLPNILDTDVPDGRDERDNMVVKTVGTPPDLGFPPKQHFELGEALGQMLFEPAAKLSGARFTILRGPLARLERALGQFMLDLHTGEHGYEETQVPLLVNDATMHGTGQLPKFAEDLFHTTDGRWLIPTAEVPLTNLAREEILPDKALPKRVTALSECFRSEAGSAGRDTRGMLRPNRCWNCSGCHIAVCCCAPATPASAPPRRSIWRSGCPARACGARSAVAPTAVTSRRGA